MEKEKLFKKYSDNLKDVLSKYNIKIQIENNDLQSGFYICPIKLSLHYIDDIKSGILTLDHVPPKSLGGKLLILTNANANNKDGYTSDKKLLNYFEGQNFLNHARKLKTKVSSKELNLQGITNYLCINKEIKDGQERIVFEFNPGFENYNVLENREFFKNWDGMEFSVRGQITKTIDKKGILKCAYLTAFSKIGYDLLFSDNGFKKDTYHLIAKVLAGEVEADDFPLVFKEGHAPLSASNVGIITHPEEYSCMIINLTFELEKIFYKYVVYLPHPNHDSFENIKNINNLSANEKIDVKFFEIKDCI